MKDHQLAAIVFTDIVGYTKKMEADEEGTMQLLARQREIIFPLVKEFGGEIIKEIGDGLLMMFTSANKAVRFALAMQELLKDDELTIRAGIHIGDVIFEEGDVFGSAVNIAARIEPLAPAGGICISGDVRSQIRNQGDIITASIGKKELKGVKETVEIFRIVTDEIVDSQIKQPFYKDLWQRRVFQITGLYLLFSYLVKTGIGFMVDEYMLSPHLTNLVWFILISLIPSIIMIAYFHGRRGVSKWTKVELIGLPINIAAAILVLIFVFQGKDLGAITTKLTIENEDGEKIEKLVIKNEFRKKIFIFNIENVSGDTALDYLQYGISAMVGQDLSQDLLLSPVNSMEIFSRIEESGYENAIGLPITLMQRFAEQRHMNYFMFGSLDKENEEFVVIIKLYDTKLTKLVSEFTVRDHSPFGLVDQLSVQLKKAMGLPDSHISGTVDLPVSEIFTNKERALYYFSLSTIENARNNWVENIQLLDKAIREDPEFALAYLTISLSYFNNGDLNAINNALRKAMDLKHKLPERQQFILKYINYVLNQQPDKALSVVKMWANLYPDDIVAHSTYAMRLVLKNMIPEAIKEYKEILRLDPEQYEFLVTLGQLYQQLGYNDSALLSYQEYARELPQEMQSYNNLGNYYSIMGNMDLAKENFEKALMLADASEEVPVRIQLANVLLFTGVFDLALEQYMDALNVSRHARDSGQVYNALENYYLLIGKAKKSLEYYKLKMSKYETFLAPKDFLARQALDLEPYLNAGEFEKAVEVLEELAVKLEPPLDKLVPFGYMFIYTEHGNIEKAREAMSGAEELIKGFGQEALMANIYYTEGRLSELSGEYEEAIVHYNEYFIMMPASYVEHVYTARCYRMLKQYDKAEQEIAIGLKYRPFNPTINYEAALVYFEMGEEDKGMEQLQRAIDIWKDADAEYEKANLAKEKWSAIKKAS